ncbi:MAG: 3-dehydroquinate synthase [Spirochaetaceae bacterium]|jgi:3-dehydroquinate synthase|nr:3-dehydroquinate synthase [Spirochaetaceae bacterium]
MTSLNFNFGGTDTRVFIQDELPSLSDILPIMGRDKRYHVICDENTKPYADEIGASVPICLSGSGEKEKNWDSIKKILKAACAAELGRDDIFIGIGGGVVSDICAFAASIYMRGARLALVSTTLLGMADAALGGKTGIDLFGIKNLAGTFYPARAVWMPLSTLKTLPPSQFKSGLAEIIKSVILDETIDENTAFEELSKGNAAVRLEKIVLAAVKLKGRIVEADPRETGTERAKLNLGHTFGHALEAAAGLGKITHGEAVAWGIVRACELGLALGITPPERAHAITHLLQNLGYETGAPHPALLSGGSGQPLARKFLNALNSDKKRIAGSLRFIIPAQKGAVIVPVSAEKMPLVQEIALGSLTEFLRI